MEAASSNRRSGRYKKKGDSHSRSKFSGWAPNKTSKTSQAEVASGNISRNQVARELSAQQLLLNQCNDLILVQQTLLESYVKQQSDIYSQSQSERDEYVELLRKLEAEKFEHSKTKYLLLAEEEKSQLLLSEIEVLKKHLDREKSTFEEAFGLLKSQSLTDTTKHESLLAKSTGLEMLNIKKDENIVRLETQVKDLNKQIKEMKKSYKVELQEANLRIQQEIYLAKQFTTDSRHASRTGFRTKGKFK